MRYWWIAFILMTWGIACEDNASQKPFAPLNETAHAQTAPSPTGGVLIAPQRKEEKITKLPLYGLAYGIAQDTLSLVQHINGSVDYYYGGLWKGRKRLIRVDTADITAYIIDQGGKNYGLIYGQKADSFYQVLMHTSSGKPLYIKEKDVKMASIISMPEDTFFANFDSPGPIQSRGTTQGIGFMIGPFYQMNYFAQRPRTPFEDSIVIFDHTLQQKIGTIPVVGSSLYTYEAVVDSNGKIIHYYACDEDRSTGMSSLEYLRAYDKRGDFVRMFQGKYGELETWIRLSDAQRVDSTFGFMTWLDYFKRFPDGNEGWEQGYEWIGGIDFLHIAPSDLAPVLLELPLSCEIYLEGEYDENWAKVTVKEARQIMTEAGYSGTTNYTHIWQGWLKIVDENGHPLIEEIILGC